MISKYPPIQGGISARTYWMARGFAERGIEVHVVTNANCVEKEYLICDTSPDSSQTLHVHFLDPDLPWHIPDSRLYVPRLLDKALGLAEETRFDLIDTGYLIPYGIVGYLLSKITGIPYVLRHGGSDLEKFFRKDVLGNLLIEVIVNAAAIITDEKNRETFRDLNSRICIVPRYIPDERYFRPHSSTHTTPTFAYIGKINYHWRHKGLHRIPDIFDGLNEEYRLLFIGQGKGFKEFSDYVEGYKELQEYEYLPFVHPMKMPSLLNEIDSLIFFTKDNPLKDYSNIMCEALWSGVRVLIDDTLDLNSYTEYIEVTDKDQTINLPIDDSGRSQSKILEIIRRWREPHQYSNKVKFDFNAYLDANLDAFNNI